MQEGDNSKLSLWNSIHRLDTRPILPGCGCYSCSTYNRAYIHHLLIEHELLANTLLYIHNLHHMLSFMSAIRAAIMNDALESFNAQFLISHKTLGDY